MPFTDQLKNAVAILNDDGTHFTFAKNGANNAVFFSENNTVVFKVNIAVLENAKAGYEFHLLRPEVAVERWNTLQPKIYRTAKTCKATIFFKNGASKSMTGWISPFIKHYGDPLTAIEIKNFLIQLFLGDPSKGIPGGAFLADACAMCEKIIGNIRRLADGTLTFIDTDELYFLSQRSALQRKGSQRSLDLWYSDRINLFRRWYFNDIISHQKIPPLIKNIAFFLAAMAYWIQKKEFSPFSQERLTSLTTDEKLVEKYANRFFEGVDSSDDDCTEETDQADLADYEKKIESIRNEILANIKAANQSEDPLFSDTQFNKQWNKELTIVLKHIDNVEELKDIYGRDLTILNRIKILPYTEDVLKRLIAIHEGKPAPAPSFFDKIPLKSPFFKGGDWNYATTPFEKGKSVQQPALKKRNQISNWI